MTIKKYPRTRHVRGSRFQNGDYDLESVAWADLEGKHLVVEEKIDGANCGASFDENANILLQSRGHYLRGGPRERQFDLFKKWANENTDMLFDVLGNRYVFYAEWMYAKHTCFYDLLPSYVMEFDVLDTETGHFLSTPRRRELFKGRLVHQVLVLHEGPLKKLSDLASFVTRSNFISENRDESLKKSCDASGQDFERVKRETDMSTDMEGLYIKWEEDGIVKGRYKYVRESFTSKILDTETHWHDRPIVPNRLK